MPHRSGHERPPPRGTHPSPGREPGQHLLADPRHVARLLAAAAVRPEEIAVDLGAGRGALTRPLAERARRVVAVERDTAFAAHLRRTFAGRPHVEVVTGDLLCAPLPAEPFVVVANLPFGAGTAAVRRLLRDGHGMTRAVLVLQRQAARRLAGAPPHGGRFAATWAPWFSLEVLHPIPSSAFAPAPRVEAAALLVRPRARPLLGPAAYAEHGRLLGAVFDGRAPDVGRRLSRALGARRARRVLTAAGIDPRASPSAVPAETWAAVTRAALAARNDRRLARGGGSGAARTP